MSEAEISRRDMLKKMALALGAAFLPAADAHASAGRIYLAVPFHWQHHTLSCEAAALRMAAHYFGATWSEDELLRRMPVDTAQPRLEGDQVVWSDPNLVFPGNVNGWQLYQGGLRERPERARGRLWGYGLHAPAIADMATRIGLSAEVLGGLGDVYESIDRGRVPIVIVPDGGRVEARRWAWYTPAGHAVRVINREHSVVVKGYSDGYVWVNDPKGQVARYDRGPFERAFSLLNSAVAIGRGARMAPVRHFAL
ncbi:MAG TPA: C39 family peptidase [Anaerolineae bacterium]|nr:C39 family peptidase [Anaerolineae bacterium]